MLHERITSSHGFYMYSNASVFTKLSAKRHDFFTQQYMISLFLSHVIVQDFILIAAKYFIIYRYHILLTTYPFVGHVGPFHFLILSWIFLYIPICRHISPVSYYFIIS